MGVIDWTRSNRCLLNDRIRSSKAFASLRGDTFRTIRTGRILTVREGNERSVVERTSAAIQTSYRSESASIWSTRNARTVRARYDDNDPPHARTPGLTAAGDTTRRDHGGAAIRRTRQG